MGGRKNFWKDYKLCIFDSSVKFSITSSIQLRIPIVYSFMVPLRTVVFSTILDYNIQLKSIHVIEPIHFEYGASNFFFNPKFFQESVKISKFHFYFLNIIQIFYWKKD